MYITPNQAVKFWDELVRCLHNENGYGGNVCEIYVSTMMEHNSLYANNPVSVLCESERRNACRAMADLIEKFEQYYPDHKVRLLDEVEDGDWKTLRTEAYSHRLHFSVMRDGADHESDAQ